MLFDLNPVILAEFIRVKNDGLTYSQIMRHLFKNFGEISPPIMAEYFVAVYGFQVFDYLPTIASWWPDSSSEISDDEFDRGISRGISLALKELNYSTPQTNNQ